MGKNSKKNKQKGLQNSTVQGNSVQTTSQSASVPEVEVTKEDLENSTTQAEFEKNKDALLTKAWDELNDVNNEIDNVKGELNGLKEEKQKYDVELPSLRDEYNNIQTQLKEAETKVKNAETEAKGIKDSADEYAEKVRKEADSEKMNAVAEASKEARLAWKKQIDELSDQLNDIANREQKLDEGNRQLDRERRKIEDEKEAIAELKEDLINSKERYKDANPAKISGLETDLQDEKDRYKELHGRYQILSDRLQALQVTMDTIKTEIDDPENGVHVASMNEVVSALQEFREKHDKLASVYSRYPDDKSIADLEEKVKQTEKLERENESLQQERNKYREEAVAARNATKELETIKQEVEATNALNEHLLQELESHKTALESRTGDTCPSLSKVDSETEDPEFVKDINARTQRNTIASLKELVEHVKNYAGSRPNGEALYYTDNDIRAFLAGLSVSRLIILQGMSGTGKSSLPRIFSEAISGFDRLIPVESSWRDRNELLGYYNDFNKKFNAKTFTIELYRSSKDRCQDIPTFIVLDEMNLARIEYYFSDFLAILQEPDHDKWLIELVSSDMRTLPMELPDEIKKKMKKDDPSIFAIWEKIEKSRQGDLKAETSDEDKERLTSYLEKMGQLTGAKSLIDGRKIRVTDNIWFVGTANRDESTFEISDKVYDRAQVVSLNRKGISEGKYIPTNEKFISVSDLNSLFEDAIRGNKTKKKVEDALNALDNVLMEKFDMSFGNRIVTQTIDFVAVFSAAGGSVEDALDYQISTKIIRKVITSDNEEALLELQDKTKNYKETQKLIDKRLKELR